MIFNKYKEFGFSLVEAMVGLGLMTAVGVGVMQLQGQQVKTQKNLDADYEIKMLSSIIYNNLKTEAACRETLKDLDFSSTSSFGEIKNENGNTILNSTLSKGTKEIFKGKNDIEIVRYLAEPDPIASFSDMGDGTKTGKVRIAIEYRKANAMLKNDNVYKKYLSLPIRVRLTNSDNKLNDCVSGGDEAIMTALKQFCESLNGEINVSDPTKCDLKYAETNTDGELLNNKEHQAVSAAHFGKFRDDYISPNFVFNRDYGEESAIEGTLNAEKKIILLKSPYELEVSQQKARHALRLEDVIKKNTCKDPGTIGVMTKNGLECRPSFMCSHPGDDNQEYFLGIDSEGNAICNTLVKGADCPNGSGSLKVDINGSVTFDCCSPDCDVDSASYCSGEAYAASNGCGLCTGTKPSVTVTPTWKDTGDVRDTSLCMDGNIQTEKKQVAECSGVSECGGTPCIAGEERWISGPLKPCTNCVAPTTVEVTVTETTAKINWTPKAVGHEFRIEIGDVGFTPGGAEAIVTADHTGDGYTITGLMPKTLYGLRVGRYCGEEGAQPWVWHDEIQFETEEVAKEWVCSFNYNKYSETYWADNTSGARWSTNKPSASNISCRDLCVATAPDNGNKFLHAARNDHYSTSPTVAACLCSTYPYKVDLVNNPYAPTWEISSYSCEYKAPGEPSCNPTKSCPKIQAETCSGQSAGKDSCGNSCGIGTKDCSVTCSSTIGSYGVDHACCPDGYDSKGYGYLVKEFSGLDLWYLPSDPPGTYHCLRMAF